MLIEVNYDNIYDLVKAKGYDNDEAEIISDYIDSLSIDGFDLETWLKKEYFHVIVDGNEKEALEYIKKEGYGVDNCFIYTGNKHGVLIEYC